MSTVASVQSPFYALDSNKSVPWNAIHEKTVSKDYPYRDLSQETPEEFVQRTYLQFLWLPQSIMPLSLLLTSLNRVTYASSSDRESQKPHPLHAILAPILMTTRSVFNKYHTELPKILENGGGAGEIEECMMWYSLNLEKVADDATDTENGDIPPWENTAWKATWIDRMERRETLIQILLCFHLLSLQEPTAVDSPIPSTRKRKRHPPKELSLAERLESFMDKLSMWQLIGGLNSSTNVPEKEVDLDWAQRFYKEVIESRFESALPDTCALFRSKIFPTSPFSDDDESVDDSGSVRPARTSDTRHNPTPSNPHQDKRLSAKLSSSRTEHLSVSTTTKELSTTRSRSRSLSVSLAEEKRERNDALAAGAKKKRVLNREVSMSRKLGRTKSRGPTPVPTMQESGNQVTAIPVRRATSVTNDAVVLVEATPVKGKPLGRRPSGYSCGAAMERPTRESEEIWDLAGSSEALILEQQFTGSPPRYLDRDFYVDTTPVKTKTR